MNSRSAAILIVAYAMAAAVWFLGSVFLITQLNVLPEISGMLGAAVGLVGLGYFVRRAEAERNKLRRR